LTADIDLDPNLPGRKVFDRAVIAADTNEPDLWYSFNGVLDGNGFTISNLNCKSEEAYYTGLFGFVSNGTIKDLRLANANIDAGTGKNVGSLVGMNIYGTISGCSVQGGSVTGGKYVSGLVGYNAGFITDCYSNTIVLGIMFVGGLVGENSQLMFREAGIISNCYSTGTVSGNVFVGGLVGQNGTWLVGGGEISALEGQIDNCYSNCNVTGKAMIGGLVGFNNVGIITQCYSNGIVSGNELVGGLIGKNNARVNVCFWDIETSGLTFSAAGIGKTTAEMQTADTFILWGACGPLWTIDEGRNYPHLAWENMPGEFITGPTYGRGNGTAQDPYLIYSAEELNMLGLSFCDWDKHFKLMANIDLSDFWYDDALIAQGGWWEGIPFTGVFDGNGHTISHLTIIGENNLGLFSYLGSGAEVRDLGVLDVNIVGSDMVGALAGINNGNLIRCYSSGAVSGVSGVGGLVGDSWESIDQCYSSCIVTGGDWAGGLVGDNIRGNIAESYSTGEVSGGRVVGGLVGDNSGIIINCYSTNTVSGNWTIGGLVGYNRDGSITDSLWDKQISSQYDMCGSQSPEASGCSNAYGKTTVEMQTADTLLNVGWDFVDETANGTEDIWWIDEGKDYPRLWWEANN
jgi:hypothetical protein